MSTDHQDSTTNLDVCTLVMVALEGAYRLFEKLGKQKAVEVLQRVNRLVRELADAHGGRELERTHRFLFRFDRPLDGVLFCLAVHDRAAELGKDLDLALAARCGVHLDEVVQWENSPDAVARGARPREIDGPARERVTHLTSIAHPRQTLLTHLAHDLAKRAAKDALTEDVVWAEHGAQLFPEGGEPYEIFEVGRQTVAPFVRPGLRETASVEIQAMPWQPVEGAPLPGRQHWVLQRRLGVTTAGDAWVCGQKRVGDQHTFLFGTDLPARNALQRELRALRELRELLRDPPFLARPVEARLKEQPFYLELDDGRAVPLRQWLDGRSPEQKRDECLALAVSLADALAACHAEGVVVGEVTPERLLVRSDGKVVLADAGSCRVDGEDVTADPGLKAPAPYRAPELRGSRPPTPASDVYAAGVLFFQLLAGDLDAAPGPFWERSLDDAILCEDVGALLDPDPDARPSAAEWRERLRTLGERQPQAPDAEEVSAAGDDGSVPRWVAVAAAVAGLLAGLAAGAGLF